MSSSESSDPPPTVPNLSLLAEYVTAPTECPILDPTVVTSSAVVSTVNSALGVMIRYII
jgi:hypothetical protein